MDKPTAPVPVSVIVPIRNEAENLPRCLGSIGWADPDARLAVAICHNRMFDAPTPEGNPFVPIGNAVREALGVAG